MYVIAVSGYGQEANQRRALNEGFDAYLTKPIDLKELQRLLRRPSRHERPAGWREAAAEPSGVVS